MDEEEARKLFEGMLQERGLERSGMKDQLAREIIKEYKSHNRAVDKKDSRHSWVK